MTSFSFITRSVRVTSCALLACALSNAVISARAQDFNLSRDFSTNSNPHDVWSYGTESTLGGAFSVAMHSGQGFGDNGVPYEAWSQDAGVAPFFAHFPLSNLASATSDGGQGQYPPGTVVFYAGFDGSPNNFAVIRFTAPSNGAYTVATAVRAYLNGPSSGDSDFHIFRNGASLLSRFLSPSGSMAYTNTLVLAAGETIDFAAGRGEDGIQYGSGLNIQLVITPSANALPFVTQHPFPVAAKTGTRAAFHVVASSSTPVQYQWFFDGEAIAGETGSRLVVRPVRPRDAGTYSVRVNNQAGSVWAAAVLTVERGLSGRDR